MTWYCIYDVTTGYICGTANFHLPDEVYAAQGKAQIVIADDFITDNLMVDVTQNPVVFIPIPPFPSPAPMPFPAPSPSPMP